MPEKLRPLYDPANGPLAWPVCSNCDTPYIMRYTWIPGPNSGTNWAWYVDCKCKPRAEVRVEVLREGEGGELGPAAL